MYEGLQRSFSGFDLHSRYIINVIPLVLSTRFLDKFCQDFCHFQILLYNFVYNVKANIKLTGKHATRTLAIFNIFDHFWDLSGLFLCCDNEANPPSGEHY